VSALAALLLTAAWVAPVLAELDDGDGFDGDELVLPPVLLALGGVAAWALLRGRRGGTPSAGR
jgi:uncharacterized RDD family membrane protein YckC